MIGAIFVTFSQLILVKIITIVLPIDVRLDFKAKCTKFKFRLGLRPDPAVELAVLPQTP